jgi:hypothetical protein
MSGPAVGLVVSTFVTSNEARGGSLAALLLAACDCREHKFVMRAREDNKRATKKEQERT